MRFGALLNGGGVLQAGELQADGRSTAVVAVSFFEVYQNSLRDLLAAKGKESAIEIRWVGSEHAATWRHTLPGLTLKTCHGMFSTCCLS